MAQNSWTRLLDACCTTRRVTCDARAPTYCVSLFRPRVHCAKKKQNKTGRLRRCRRLGADVRRRRELHSKGHVLKPFSIHSFLNDLKPETPFKSHGGGSTRVPPATQVKYDPSKCTYEDLCAHFYTFHDPTTLNRQVSGRCHPEGGGVVFIRFHSCPRPPRATFIYTPLFKLFS